MADDNKPSFMSSVFSGLGGAIKGAFGMGTIGMVGGAALGAGGAAVADIVQNGALDGFSLTVDTGSRLVTASADATMVAAGGAAIGGLAGGSIGAAVGTPLGAMTGVIKSREVEDNGPSKQEIATVAFAKGVEIGQQLEAMQTELEQQAKPNFVQAVRPEGPKTLTAIAPKPSEDKVQQVIAQREALEKMKALGEGRRGIAMAANKNIPESTEAVTLEAPGPSKFIGGAARGAVGMALTGAITLGLAGAGVAAGANGLGIETVTNAISNTLSFASGSTAMIAAGGAAIGAGVGAVLGAPAGAMAGMLGVRQKFVEEQVIPKVAQVALVKGVGIGLAQQPKLQEVSESIETESKAYLQDIIKNGPKQAASAQPKDSKSAVQNVVENRAALALASMEPMGRA